MWMRELEVLCMDPPQGFNLSEGDLEGYLGNNTARILGIEPTSAPASAAEATAYLERSSGMRVEPRPEFVLE
jgi:hypothetical protein